jgi:hypothetical protein
VDVGEVDRVDIKKIYYKDIKNTVFTHNHPGQIGSDKEGGTPLSSGDMQFFFNTGAKEVRAVSGDWTYSMRWNKDIPERAERSKIKMKIHSTVTMGYIDELKNEAKKVADEMLDEGIITKGTYSMKVNELVGTLQFDDKMSDFYFNLARKELSKYDIIYDREKFYR